MLFQIRMRKHYQILRNGKRKPQFLLKMLKKVLTNAYKFRIISDASIDSASPGNY